MIFAPVFTLAMATISKTGNMATGHWINFNINFVKRARQAENFQSTIIRERVV